MRRIAAAAALLLLAACSSTPAPGPVVVRWDGRYYGNAVSNGNGVECDLGATPLRITVASGRAWIGPRHRRHRVEGWVDAAGKITLQNDTGSHSLRGAIVGDQLTAVEETPQRRSLSQATPGSVTPCMAIVTATRLSGGAQAEPAD